MTRTLHCSLAWLCCAWLPVTFACNGSSSSARQEVRSVQPPRASAAQPRGESSIDACSSSFVTGPVWAMVDDKTLALEEARWVAVLGFREDTSSAAREGALKSLLDEGVEVSGTREDEWVLVSGRPSTILSNIESSCVWGSFDLTGIHCGCAPRACERVMRCELVHARFDSEEAKALGAYRDMKATTPSYKPVLGCLQDVRQGNKPSFHRIKISYDFRGVGWFLGNHDTRMRSWEEARCERRADEFRESAF